MPKDELSGKQKAFADYYLQSYNATEAMTKAGYAGKYVGTNADKLLKNTKIRKYINERSNSMSAERIATAQEVLEYLTGVMRGDRLEERIVTDKEGAEEIKRQKPKLYERTRAAEMLAKYHKLLTDKQEIDVAANVSLEKKLRDLEGDTF